MWRAVPCTSPCPGLLFAHRATPPGPGQPAACHLLPPAPCAGHLTATPPACTQWAPSRASASSLAAPDLKTLVLVLPGCCGSYHGDAGFQVRWLSLHVPPSSRHTWGTMGTWARVTASCNSPLFLGVVAGLWMRSYNGRDICPASLRPCVPVSLLLQSPLLTWASLGSLSVF